MPKAEARAFVWGNDSIRGEGAGVKCPLPPQTLAEIEAKPGPSNILNYRLPLPPRISDLPPALRYSSSRRLPLKNVVLVTDSVYCVSKHIEIVHK